MLLARKMRLRLLTLIFGLILIATAKYENQVVIDSDLYDSIHKN